MSDTMRKLIPPRIKFGMFISGLFIMELAGILFKLYAIDLEYVEIIIGIGAVIFFASIIA